MTRILNYIYLLLIASLAGLVWGCSDDAAGGETHSGGRYLRINGTPKSFSEVEVSTRSPKNEFETKLSTLHLLIFDRDGQIVGTPQFSSTGVPTFIIDTHGSPFISHDQAKLLECDILMVGNLEAGDLAGIRSLAELLEFEVEAVTIHPDTDPSFRGLVMLGRTQDKVNLSTSRPSSDGNILEISMVSIYAKVVVNLRVQPDQHLPGNDQHFRMMGWKVVNAPRYATLGAPAADASTAPPHSDKIASETSTIYSGANPVGVSQSLSYSFYMLEHKRNRLNAVTYPEGIEETAKQRFKPKFVDEDTDAAYMVIEGIYTDHQGRAHETAYKLYLGANAIDDFYILRDNQYNNDITIKGVTSNSSFEETSVSYDARVTVNSGPIVISVKRDTQLDCHYEVRPLDIYVSPGYVVSVAVEEGEARNWIGLDRERQVAGVPVKRDYFTTDLVAALPKSYGSFTDDFRVWAYFDENTETADRMGKIIFTCTETASGDQTVITYTFLQKGLFQVTYDGNTYFIEFHEEYLHNFDPNDPYNNKTDGMFWGLEGWQLSKSHDAFIYNGWTGEVGDGVVKNAISKYQNYKYDFYTHLDEGTVGNRVTLRSGAGHAFTDEIVKTVGIDRSPLKLTGTARSAVEYCYNKNKRDASGRVVNMKWYLPAIDEIEDIVMGAYDTFTDFQAKFYWSSQPAYNRYTYTYSGLSSGEGVFYNDNVTHARATSVSYEGGNNYGTENSGMNTHLINYKIRLFSGNTVEPNGNLNDSNYGKGYMPRDKINRIRCVYRKN